MTGHGIKPGDYLVHLVSGVNADSTKESKPHYLIRQFTTEPGQRMRFQPDEVAARRSALRLAREAQTNAWLETGLDTGVFRLIQDDESANG